MRLDYRSPEALAPVVEALLFASDEALPAAALRSLILGEEQPKTEITDDAPAEVPEAAATNEEAAISEPVADGSTEASEENLPTIQGAPTEKKRKKRQLIELVTLHVAVQHLNSLYEEQSRSFRIVEIAGGYQFATRPEYSEYVARLTKEKSRRRLSGAALESLAIIAYKQPVSKVDVENIRGVNCDEVLKSLLEKNLITITGRAEAVGRPLLYGTTVDFLRHFGLHTLTDLPRPREIDELMKEESVRATTLEEAASEFVTDQSGEDNTMTVDEAVAVARELAEMEAIEEGNRDSEGIELDLEAMESMEAMQSIESMNPGHAQVVGEADVLSD